MGGYGDWRLQGWKGCCRGRIKPVHKPCGAWRNFSFQGIWCKIIKCYFWFFVLKKNKKNKTHNSRFCTNPGQGLRCSGKRCILCNDVTSVKPHVVVSPLGPRYSQQNAGVAVGHLLYLSSVSVATAQQTGTIRGTKIATHPVPNQNSASRGEQ